MFSNGCLRCKTVMLDLIIIVQPLLTLLSNIYRQRSHWVQQQAVVGESGRDQVLVKLKVMEPSLRELIFINKLMA